MSTENEAQKNIRLGAPLETLNPTQRLEWANAATPGTVAEVEAEPEPVETVDDGLTDQARRFLNGRDPATLDRTDTEIFTALNGSWFRKPADAATPEPKKPAAPPPFELDVELLNAANLPPAMRAMIHEAFVRADIGRKESAAGTHPSVRTVKEFELDAAMLRVRPYLRRAT